MSLLTDSCGRTIGMLRYSGTITRLYNAQGRYLGAYYSNNNMTFDAQGRKIGVGNLLTSLLNKF